MHRPGFLFSFSLLCFSAFPGAFAQQAPDLSSGLMIVRLQQTVDAAHAQPGQPLAAIVMRSSNPAVPRGAHASVTLAPDPSGETLELIKVDVNGQLVGTASSAVALTGIGIVSSMSRAAGTPPTTLAGARVFVPANTDLRFTLAPPAPQQVENPAANAPPSSPAAAGPSTANANSPASQQYPYTLEGIGLRMTLEQLRAAAAAAGSVKGLVKQGPMTYNFNTRDLGFQVEMNEQGWMKQYNVVARNPHHLPETQNSGPLYDILTKAFGPQAGWGKQVIYDLGEGTGAYAIVSDASLM